MHRSDLTCAALPRQTSFASDFARYVSSLCAICNVMVALRQYSLSSKESAVANTAMDTTIMNNDTTDVIERLVQLQAWYISAFFVYRQSWTYSNCTCMVIY